MTLLQIKKATYAAGTDRRILSLWLLYYTSLLPIALSSFSYPLAFEIGILGAQLHQSAPKSPDLSFQSMII
jgi:hypothetical protein